MVYLSNASTGAPRTSYAGNTSNSVYAWGFQLNRGPIATPYLATTTAARIGIPQSYDAAAAQYGILVEPAATNVFAQSEDVSTGTTLQQLTITTNNTTAPDGTTTADRVNITSGAGAHNFYKQVSLTGAINTTTSCYVKAGTSSYIFMSVQNPGTQSFHAIFDISSGGPTATQTGAEGGGTFTSSSVVAVGDGWYRIALTGTINSNHYLSFGAAPAATGNTVSSANLSYTAAGTETFYCWGVQSEDGSVATSYIPTLGSTVTRAADKITALLTTIPLGSEYTLYANSLSRGSGGGGQYMWAVDKQDGLDNAAAINYNSPGAGALGLTVRSGGATTANINGGAVSEAAQFKAAARVKLNDFGVSVDGAAVATDVSGAIPVSPTHVSFWGSENPGGATGFHFQNAIYPRAFTDPQLVTRAT
jgi:hypothetical protein